MANPRFENVSQMENATYDEDDLTVSMKLTVTGLNHHWVRVVWNGETFRYYEDIGARRYDIARFKAQALIDRQWGRK